VGRCRRIALALAAGLSVTVLGCKSDPEIREGALPPAPPPVTSAKPVDHLGPDELLEGSGRAFGLALPRGIEVERTFEDVVYAAGVPKVRSVVQYLRPRLRDGGFRQTDSTATFERVKIPGKPGQEFEIKVARIDGRTRVEVRDVTPRPVPDLPDEAARWRQVGLTKDGKFLDPTHVE